MLEIFIFIPAFRYRYTDTLPQTLIYKEFPGDKINEIIFRLMGKKGIKGKQAGLNRFNIFQNIFKFINFEFFKG